MNVLCHLSVVGRSVLPCVVFTQSVALWMLFRVFSRDQQAAWVIRWCQRLFFSPFLFCLFFMTVQLAGAWAGQVTSNMTQSACGIIKTLGLLRRHWCWVNMSHVAGGRVRLISTGTNSVSFLIYISFGLHRCVLDVEEIGRRGRRKCRSLKKSVLYSFTRRQGSDSRFRSGYTFDNEPEELGSVPYPFGAWGSNMRVPD